MPYGPPPPRRPVAAADDSSSSSDAPHYLIAFKDRTIYTAMAYWVDGDTLHYFTIGNTHNQVSLTLVDRDLTERLNQESGVDLKLPPPASAK
jgi:endonuclease YncB( thermonuclease family)